MSQRRMTVEDVRRFELASNPCLSPDGQWVIFERMITDVKEDGYDTQLMIVSSYGGACRTLTTSGTSNTSAAWSPDGKSVAFVSNRAFGSQVWVLPLDGGEARQLTRFRNGMSSPVWSPDGGTIYGLVPVGNNLDVEVFADETTAKEAKEELEKENKDWASGSKRYDRLYYKMDGIGLSKNQTEQLVAVEVETGAYHQLTFGSYDVGSIEVSPDGKYAAFVSNRRDPDLEWWRSDVYRVPTVGGEVERLSDDIMAHRLAYSPDGKHLAVIGHGDEFYDYWSAAHAHLFLMPANGGAARHVTADFPDTLGDTNLSDLSGNAQAVPPTWSKDGRFVYTLSTREGRCEVVRFDVTDTHGSTGVVVIGGDRDVYGFSFDGDSRFIISYATQTKPSLVAAVNVSEGTTQPRTFRAVTELMHEEPVPFFPKTEIRLDDSNMKFLEEVTVVQPEPFYYTSQDGWRVQGWVMRPAECEQGRQYPVILEIHGGPQLNYGYAMFHEMQWFAAEGYAIVLTNPRGGMSYGQEFVNAVRHNYGTGDAADVVNGLDAALARFDFLDSQRVAVTGGSYGGFMTNWLVGHTDRFFAAVSQRSISNWISFYGVSDIGPLFTEAQHGGDVMNDFEKLWEISPLAYVKNVKTPLLLIHSENDLRCPIEQAEQFYTCIKRQGGEVELFRVPNASHGLSRNGKPTLRLERLKAIFNFIHGHLPKTPLETEG